MLSTTPPNDGIPNSDAALRVHFVRFIFIPLRLVVHLHESFEAKRHGILVYIGRFMDPGHGEKDPFVLAESVGRIVDLESGVFLDVPRHESVHM